MTRTTEKVTKVKGERKGENLHTNKTWKLKIN